MSSFIDYESCLDWLYTQLPMYQRQGASAMKKDLTNIHALLNFLQEPHLSYPTIHIAGTNGKGTTAHLLSAVLQAQGLRTGMYTSPHYIDFRERIKINGAYIDKDSVLSFVAKIKPLLDSVQASFFEITVAMAFQFFAEQKVDIALIEVGLGGRLDSTNVLLPELSIITNISFDHQAMLGNTLREIAGEKAGIIKSSVPVLIGKKQEKTMRVFDAKAKEMGAPIYYAEDIIKVDLVEVKDAKSLVKIESDSNLFPEQLWVDVSGPFQLENIRTVLGACLLLNEKPNFDINAKNLAEGLQDVKKKTRYHGRWQYLSYRPDLIVDGAHNEAGLRSVLKALAKKRYAHTHIVLGFVNDKDLSSILPLFPKEASYYFSQAAIPRALASKELQKLASIAGIRGKTYPSIVKALGAAKAQAKQDDLIFVGGSIFTVAEVLPK